MKTTFITFKQLVVVVTVLVLGEAGVSAEEHQPEAEVKQKRAEQVTSELQTKRSLGQLAHEIFETMIKVRGTQPEHRPVHAKGLVCQGTFEPSQQATSISKAAHFQQTAVGVTVRFSNGSPDPMSADNSPNSGPRGMAVRFLLPGGDETDIVAMSHNGFVVGNGEEFLELQKAIVATDPGNPHPWPVEVFVGSHPAALKFVQENMIVPASFATEAFFSNDSFVFVNKTGVRQTGRYQIIPMAGQKSLSPNAAKEMPADFLIEDMKGRVTAKPVKYKVVVQLPNAGDRTDDPSIVWPENRRTIDMGIITISSVVPDNESASKALAFDPINLTDGLELSNDQLPLLRSKVYALSARHRQELTETANSRAGK